jgi:hypothetical protein
MRTIEQILTLWSSSLMTSDEVVEWARHEVERLDAPAMELFDLLSYGPEKCLRSMAEFSPRPIRLTFNDEFCIRACELSLASDEAVRTFVMWASRSCMGEDVSDPLVAMSYHLDHLLNDCQDEVAALALVRQNLPPMLPHCAVVAAPFLCDAP